MTAPDFNILSERPALAPLTPSQLAAVAKFHNGPRPKPIGSFEIDHGGLTFTVYGRFYEALPESKLSPAEPASFEVEQIWLGDVEVSGWLAENAPRVVPEIEGRLA